MKHLLIVGALYCSLLTACTRSKAEYNIRAPENKYILCRGSALYLNDGKKWKSNMETTKGINDMIELVHKVVVPADTLTYHALGDTLMQEYLYIINYCEDMGEAHELIHAYLFPLHELIIPLQISGQATCDAQYLKIKEHLDKYHQYFE